MEAKDHKIAIIVPVYNVEKYLSECLLSIKNQKFQNWDCFIINDDSFDDSLKIAEEFSSIDKRFKIYSKKNGGVSAARNYALDIIYNAKEHYDYIAFVDADDRISPEMYERLIKTITETNSEIALCGMYNFNESGRIWQKPKNSTLSSRAISREDFVKLIFGVSEWRGKLCSGGHVMKLLCSLDVLKNIRFIEDRNFVEDELFCLEVALNSKKNILLYEALYGYRRREGSLTQSAKFIDMLLNCRERCISLSKRISKDSYYVVLAAYINTVINKSKIIKKRVDVEGIPDSDLRIVKSRGYLSLKQSLIFYVLSHSKFLADTYFWVRGMISR